MFNCDCVACEQNYPTLDNSVVAEIPIILTTEIIERILCHDRSIAISYLEEVENYLQKFDQYYPCQQLLYIRDIYTLMMSLAYDPEVDLRLVLKGVYYKLENSNIFE